MSKQLQVIATLIAKRGMEAAVDDLLVHAVKQFRREAGCEGYILLEDKEHAGRFVTYATWIDHAALEAHMKSTAMREIGTKLMPMLEEPIEQQFLTVRIAR